MFLTPLSNLLARKIGSGLDPPGVRVRHAPLSPLTYPVTFGASISERMEMTAFDHLKGEVMDKIVDIPEDGFVPRFRDTFVRDGVATFICNNGDSEVWLREAVKTIELGDGTLARFVLLEELINRVNVTALVTLPRREASQLVNLLGRHNPELGTSK